MQSLQVDMDELLGCNYGELSHASLCNQSWLRNINHFMTWKTVLESQVVQLPRFIPGRYCCCCPGPTVIFVHFGFRLEIPKHDGMNRSETTPCLCRRVKTWRWTCVVLNGSSKFASISQNEQVQFQVTKIGKVGKVYFKMHQVQA